MFIVGLPTPKAFDTVGEPATLQKRWTILRCEFELFCAASGIKNAKQQRALLLHIAGTGILKHGGGFCLYELRPR
jgi:hypothetical protein